MTSRPFVRAVALAGALLANLLALHAGAVAQSDGSAVMSERELARFAARVSLAEIREAQIALEHTKNDAVVHYAKMLIDDHTASNADLGKIAAAENVPMPKILTPAQESELGALQSVSAGEFDKQYMAAQVSGHYKVVASAQAVNETGASPALKAFAAQYLAAEQRHLRMAQALISNALK